MEMVLRDEEFLSEGAASASETGKSVSENFRILVGLFCLLK